MIPARNLSLLGLLLVGLGATRRHPQPVDNGLARTPPMGWNTWNHFGCNVSAQLVRETADAMAQSGMLGAGYQYLVIDDCWQVARDRDGRIVADSARFPGGMKPVADYVHSKGLKFGIYTDAGRRTCQGRPGTYEHEEQDARTYAEWGVDYVKEDWCNAQGLDGPTQYAKFRDALAHSGRPIVFSICEWGINRPWEWGPHTGNLWRTTDDIDDNWSSLLRILDLSSQYSAAGPGAWNDPDMLEVGNGGMTDDEYRAHFSLWALMAAPLMAGNDLRTMSQATHDILTNPEVIAVDQDSLGEQGKLVDESGPDLQTWMKPLKDGSRAVVLFNRTALQTSMSVSWGRARLPRGSARVRDLWTHEERGTFADHFNAVVPAHGVVMVKITPASGS
ncbi:MAG TPA: glycoside hydrolase family 27 protein [Gemmatimonadales bacterium]